MREHILAASIAALSLSLSGVAIAHEAGDVILRGGIIHAAPDTSSSKIKINGVSQSGTSAEVRSNTQLGLTGTYMVIPHLGIEVQAATPFTHEVRVKGLPAGLNGKLGDVSHLPPTVSAQYYFLNPKSRFQPYVGLGLTYTWFFNEKLTSAQKDNGFSNFKMDSSIGLSPQVGMDYAITNRVVLNAAIWRLGMSTTAKADLGNDKVKVDVDVNPWVYFFSAGFKF